MNPESPGLVAAFLDELRRAPDLQSCLSHYELLPARPPRYAPADFPLAPELAAALAPRGIHRLYSHQAAALTALRQGEHLMVATPTASGKTLIYNLPVAESLLRDPAGRALYLFPLKALEQDQLKAVEELAAALPAAALTAAVYDGDTPPERRKRLRARPPHVLISNPDMLHLGLLPYHESWQEFFGHLKFVVIDEVHTYKGIMGAHMAQVLRRLTRICRRWGSRPQYILSSATIANPREMAEKLTGLPVTVISDHGAPQAGRHFLFLNPEITAAQMAARIFVQALKRGLATICFTRARKLTELIHLWALRAAPALKHRLSSYRAGFLPEERRQIEARMTAGDLLGVVSTSALEMGIDIGGLDVCLLVGYPGTMVTTWQRSGRVGRLGRDCLIILVAQPDALDQYFIHHPQEFFARDVEAAVLDPHNPVIVKAHLPCAAQELPLELDTETAFDPGKIRPLVAELTASHHLLLSADGRTHYPRSRFPQKDVNIRGIGQSFAIFKTGGRRPIGTIDGHRALTECHPGAVYLHKANSFLVTRLDLERRNIQVEPVEPDYFTRIQSDKETDILEVLDSRPVAAFTVHLGRLKVTQRILAYEKRRLHTQELLGVIPLELPPQVFETVGLWLTIADPLKAAVGAAGLHFMGGIHALEHALISMFPLFALADRYDIGGISHPHHDQVGGAAVFIYDGYPGGVGLAARAYEIIQPLLEKTRELIAACPCEDGCPSCIHSPKCGSGNKPLDKAAALQIAEMLLGRRPAAAEPPATLAVAASPPPPPAPADDADDIALPWGDAYRILVLDLETRFSAAEVGGWGKCRDMRVSVAVLGESPGGRFEVYTETDIARLCQRLAEADLVVGFNIRRFDYQVLQPYTTVDLQSLPTLDILEEVHNRLGLRLSLNHLVEKTLGRGKTGDGLLALQLFREGRLEELISYCREDVRLTRELFAFGVHRGHLLYQHRQGALVRLPVDWSAPRLFPRTAP